MDDLHVLLNAVSLGFFPRIVTLCPYWQNLRLFLFFFFKMVSSSVHIYIKRERKHIIRLKIRKFFLTD